jgi:hypothetical protein
MKYMHLASVAALLGAATVSGGSLAANEHDGHCPKGYTMSVYYKTITVETYPTATPVVSTIIDSPTPATIESQAFAEPTVISSSAPAIEESETQTSAAAVPIESESSTSSTHVAETSTAESAAAVALLPTTSDKPVVIQTIAAPASTEQATTTQSTVKATSTSSTSSSSSSDSTSQNAGKATFYSGDMTGGTCSFTGYTLPSHLTGTALSLSRWDDAANCGRCVSVTGPSGTTIKAMVSHPPSSLTPIHIPILLSHHPATQNLKIYPRSSTNAPNAKATT